MPSSNTFMTIENQTDLGSVIRSEEPLTIEPKSARRTHRTLKSIYTKPQDEYATEIGKRFENETVQERSERKTLAKWPNSLIKKVRKLQANNQVEQLNDIRTTLILSGIQEKMPENLTIEIVDESENPHLYRHVFTQSVTYRAGSFVENNHNNQSNKQYLTITNKKRSVQKSQSMEDSENSKKHMHMH